MEFWGVEVKAGENLKVDPGFEKILHLSQAALGEAKKDIGNDSVRLYVNVDGQKLVIGTLSHEKCAQINYDLVFDKEFEISHSWKNGSVYFTGYKSVLPESEDFSDLGSDSEEEEEEIPLLAADNGKPEQKVAKPATEKANAAKPAASAAKPKVKIAEPVKVEKPKEDDEDDDSDDEDDEDDEDDSEEDESDDEDMLGAGDDSDEDDDSSDEEDEETPTPKKGKKRPLDSAVKTPASDKKAKLVTPQKTDGKKGAVHTATPHPNKQAAKTPNSDKAKGSQTPKSAGQFSCKPCNKSFNSDGALQSHNKAKHAAAK